MYRVHGNDGATYEAPNLATLQQWVQEGRIISTTVVEDLLSGTEGPASAIEGLRISIPSAPFATEDGNGYPRVQEQPDGCLTHLPLAVAIVSTLCFSPIGVIAVIYAAKIPQFLAAGDTEKAKRYARIAYRIANLSFIAGILWVMLLVKFGMLPKA
jgi:hypothetical protein